MKPFAFKFSQAKFNPRPKKMKIQMVNFLCEIARKQ